jgi:HD-like signal output (HDOD) protein
MTAQAVAQSPSSNRSLYPSKPAFEAALNVVRRAPVPQIPDVVMALRRELTQHEPDLRVASDLIAQDPVLTGQVLRVINSPAFNLPAQVASVHQAAGLMGLARLTNLATAEVINRMLAVNQGPVRVLWESILETARIVTAIARLTSDISEDEAYLFGIMHDVGSLIFANITDNYIAEWSFRANSAPSELLIHERNTLGTDHTVVGFLLANNWKLPEYIALAILHHHGTRHLEAEDRRIPHLIALAQLAHYLVALSHGTEETTEMQDYRDQAWRLLDIGEREWEELCQQARTGGW